MEAFEQFVALAMEDENLVVAGPVKFPVEITTRKAAYKEKQVHGFEVDLIGARSNKLVLATVKSYFGSAGVRADHVAGTAKNKRDSDKYRIINDFYIRESVMRQAAERYGYGIEQVELRLYAGKFAGGHEAEVREWCANQQAGAGEIKVYNASEITTIVKRIAESKTYRDNPVLTTLKLLNLIETKNVSNRL